MQLMNHDEQICDKISSSVKKSHKISIYSKKNTKSPKKNEPQSVSRIQGPKEFHTMFMMNSDKFSEANVTNGNKFLQNYSISKDQQTGVYRNTNVGEQKRNETRGLPMRQQSYQQTRNENNFFDTTTPIIKKANTINENAFIANNHPTNNHNANINNRNTYNNNNGAKINIATFPSQQLSGHNISQMIDKEAESQTNNLSMLEGSFMTGVRNANVNVNVNPNSNPNIYSKNKQSQNSEVTNSQQQMIGNFMKFMQEQIYIAKEKCQKKVNDVLKDSAKLTSELKDKLMKNESLLREKCYTIEKMKEAIKKGNMTGGNGNTNNGKKMHSQGEILVKKELSPQECYRLHKGNPQSYYQKRVTDLQNKLSVLQLIITQKTYNKQQLDQRIQLIEKQLISYSSSKLKFLSTKVQSFLNSHTQRISSLSNSHQKIRITIQKYRQQQQKNSFNQNQLKQQQQKMANIIKELNDFMAKQFSYENYNVQKLQQDMENFKEQLRKLQNVHFQNSKMVKLLLASQEALKHFKNHYQQQQTPQKHPQKLTSLSNINQTASKYTITNPNMSKASISELSNTNEYSHVIEKVNHNQKIMMKHYNNQNNSNSESLISMSFTEEASESMTPRMRGLESVKYNDKQQSIVTGMSKYTKNTDLKQTCSQLQTSPPSASKYYLPTTKTSISIHSIMAPNESSTQQKIRNLNDLKMQTLPLLHTTSKTPQKLHQQQQNSSKKSVYYHNLSQLQQSLDNNNTSYLSIGQMEDFNISRRDIANQTSDFSDDEFFYPRYKEDQVYEWESPQKSYKTTERFLETEEFSPMKKKLMSTEQNFYQSTKSPEPNTMQQSRDKPNFMYNSSFDYEKFSDDEDQYNKQINNHGNKQQANYRIINGHTVNINKATNPTQGYKIPPPSPHLHQKHQQNFTQNQERLINNLKGVQKHEYPIKMIYDRKKSQGMIRMVDAGHPLNGKAWPLDKREVQKLESLGYVQVKTYI